MGVQFDGTDGIINNCWAILDIEGLNPSQNEA